MWHVMPEMNNPTAGTLFIRELLHLKARLEVHV
jgi:hypothetical protein